LQRSSEAKLLFWAWSFYGCEFIERKNKSGFCEYREKSFRTNSLSLGELKKYEREMWAGLAIG